MPRETRIRLGSFGRKRFEILNCSDAEAERREAKMREIASDMVAAGLAAEAVSLLKRAGIAADAEAFRVAVRLAEGLCSGKIPKKKTAGPSLTFAELGVQWTGGELRKLHPDHVRDKRSKDLDASRLGQLSKTIGNVPIAAFTLEDAERAMAALPEELSSATRRQYAQLISKVLRLAVYPCKLIDRSYEFSG